MKKHMGFAKKYLLAVILSVVCSFVTMQTVEAMEITTTQNTQENVTVTITECESVDAKTIGFAVQFPKAGFDTCEIYRGTTQTEMMLIDTAPEYWHSWITHNDGWVETVGDKRQVTFLAWEMELSGEVICYNGGLQTGKTYYYQVVLKDEEGNIVATSNIVGAETKPATPELTMAYAKSNSTAKISWLQPQYIQGYEVYRKDPAGGWKKVKTITKAKTTTYTQKKLKSGKTYYYKVRAYCKVDGKKVYSDYSTPFIVKMKNPTVKGTYKSGSIYGSRLSNNKLNDIRRVVQGFKDNYIKKGMSDYDKALAAFTYIRANCDYARRGWQYNDANTAWGALVYGEAQCSGYARGMVALCDAVGVKCKYVHANSKAINPSHQWNMIKIGNKWYIVDAQGGFFLVGSKTYMEVGMSWDKKGLPSCSTKDHPKGGFAGSEM